VKPWIWASVSHDVPVYSPAFTGTYCTYPRRDAYAELTWVPGSAPKWFTRPKMVIHLGTKWA